MMFPRSGNGSESGWVLRGPVGAAVSAAAGVAISDSAATSPVIEEPEIVPQPDYVFRVKGKLDPAGCPAPGSIPGEA